ncbi:AraC-like DNA-binding protein [Lacibacter cauensis]|uniref:AraC-like DNA-binding protein n=1 Tax=Lacibacter cauensis TaxID=510947 RepID=A0A562SVX0_9BACT|nr:AraC family transcriptional regulator [Lacibacter cauensis]TWI85437.1 AraC-like DNA-binding protein [Lacibacter cauensis]
MNPHLLKVSTAPHQSFNIRHDVVPYFYNRWHFHPEVELLHIQKGTGIQFIGDSIQRFKKDDVILVGANLPHLWRCDDAYFQKSKTLKAQSTVAHFREDFWGETFLELPENKKLKQLLEKAKRGISITGATKQFVIAHLDKMLEAKDSERIVLLLQILGKIAQSKQLKLISSAGFSTQLEQKSTDKINSVYAYTLAHFKEKISLKKIAEVSNISPNSFCRYFKVHTRKTYSNFLHELRVGHASKLLIENKLSISQICYESGFNNVTNFYKTFKRFTGQTPLAFQQAYNTTTVE